MQRIWSARSAAVVFACKVIFGVLLVAVAQVLRPEEAEASTIQWNLYSSLEPPSGQYEFGMHFDESGNPQFGARDFNVASDEGDPVFLRVNVATNQTYYFLYDIQAYGTCSRKANVRRYIGGSWQLLGGTELHFLHMENLASAGHTSYAAWVNDTIGHQVGTVADDTACGVSSTTGHSHFSADVQGSSLMFMYYRLQDTCWTDVEQTAYQCGGDFPENYDPPGIPGVQCPYSGGEASTSGGYYEYICAEWQLQYMSVSETVFAVDW